MPLVRSVPTRGPGAIKGLSAEPPPSPGLQKPSTFVQSNGSLSNASQATLACTTNVIGSGNIVLIAATWDSANTSTATVTDDKGNTYTQIDSVLDSSDQAYWNIYKCENVTNGPSTFTLNPGASAQFMRMIVTEWIGSTVDVHGDQYNSVASISASSPTVTPTVNGETIVGFCLSGNAFPNNGFVSVYDGIANVNASALLQGVAAPIAATWSLAGGSSVTAAAVVAIKPQVSAIANTLTASPGTYTITGSATTLPVAHNPSVSPGTYTITGSSTTLPVAHKPTLSPGTYTITGSATTLPVSHKPILSPGSYAITGSPTTLPVAHHPSVNPGSYAITGSPVVPPVKHAPTVSPGAYVISGFNTTLVGPGPPPVTATDIDSHQSAYGSLWIHPY